MAAAPTTPADDLELLRASAVSAGIVASGYFRRNVKTWTKESGSPVSEADIVLDRLLEQTLSSARPDYGWLSEERADNPERLAHSRVFVVDPIDGTRGFIRGDDSWTVSLAVVEDGVPIAGVVYAPARDEMYEAGLGEGARLNGKVLTAGSRMSEPPVVAAPGAVHSELTRAGMNVRRGSYFPSLAYRLVQVARGKLDAVASRRGSQDWDIAGAAIILAEAGVEFADVCAGAIRFNEPIVRHGALAAIAAPWLKPELHRALVHVYGCPPESAEPERNAQ